MKIKLTRHIEVKLWREYKTLIKLPTIKHIMTETLKKTRISELFDIVEINVILTNDKNIQQYNNQHRNINKATNVLAFQTEDFLLNAREPRQYSYLGDLILAAETILSESNLYGKTFADHFTHLLVHGTLHLLGYDHMTKAERIIMEKLEITILQSLNIASPYEQLND